MIIPLSNQNSHKSGSNLLDETVRIVPPWPQSIIPQPLQPIHFPLDKVSLEGRTTPLLS